MPTFYYKTRSLSGNTLEGELQAFSKEEAAQVLQQRGLYITFLSDKPFFYEAKKRKEPADKKPVLPFFLFFGQISSEEKMAFSVQLANMISAGLPLVRALHILVDQMTNARFRAVLEKVYRDVEGGTAFSEALEKHPQVFQPYFTSSVRAGESSGQLGTVLESVASFTEHDMEVRQNIQAAMMYPIILVVVGIAIVSLIVMHVIPSFVQTFLHIGVKLPIPTQILFDISTFLKTQFDVLAVTVFGVVFFGRFFMGTPFGRFWFDEVRLKIPLLGQVIQRFALSRFCRTLSMLLSCGVPILQSIKIAEDNVDNLVYSRALEQAHEMIRQGVKIADALKEVKVFPVDMVQMVAVGEETGRVDQLLRRLGDYYDMVAKYSVKKFMATLEPVFLVVLGSVVAFIMASVLLPIFDMMRLLRQT
ncbi:MAG: type II secretion system F family protein [Candidatus Omnitrophota bacterium]